MGEGGEGGGANWLASKLLGARQRLAQHQAKRLVHERQLREEDGARAAAPKTSKQASTNAHEQPSNQAGKHTQASHTHTHTHTPPPPPPPPPPATRPPSSPRCMPQLRTGHETLKERRQHLTGVGHLVERKVVAGQRVERASQLAGVDRLPASVRGRLVVWMGGRAGEKCGRGEADGRIKRTPQLTVDRLPALVWMRARTRKQVWTKEVSGRRPGARLSRPASRAMSMVQTRAGVERCAAMEVD
eukprot:364036-Chlamydomonas_euryale.AAC.1